MTFGRVGWSLTMTEIFQCVCQGLSESDEFIS